MTAGCRTVPIRQCVGDRKSRTPDLIALCAPEHASLQLPRLASNVWLGGIPVDRERAKVLFVVGGASPKAPLGRCHASAVESQILLGISCQRRQHIGRRA